MSLSRKSRRRDRHTLKNHTHIHTHRQTEIEHNPSTNFSEIRVEKTRSLMNAGKILEPDYSSLT